IKAVATIWMIEGGRGLFRGSVPRVVCSILCPHIHGCGIPLRYFGTEADSK
ncbi:hypothetical protein MKW98_009847, partial [Papaver atlanticum]